MTDQDETHAAYRAPNGSGHRERNRHTFELFHRHPANPILSVADWPYPANTVFNPGAVRLPDGETLLLVRVEDRRGLSHLTIARSADGLSNWRIDSSPTIPADPQGHPEELWGIEDPRIVWLPEIEQYAITYTAYSRTGPLVALMLTRDFRSFDRRGPIMPPEDKDSAFFPRRVAGRWALIHRPVPTQGKANMWLSFSPDLKHWGDHMVLMEARDGAYWDAGKIGLSPPPVETSEGWLVIYHGVRHTPAGALYRTGLALLDLDDPRRVILRGDEWVFGPEAPYELAGDVENVVFPCGATSDLERDELRIYYGASDTSVAVATARISELIQWLRDHTTKHVPRRRAGDYGPLGADGEPAEPAVARAAVEGGTTH
ncbi:glycosidase [soil metagenome]